VKHKIPSPAGEGRVRGNKKGEFLNLDTLILAYSRREKGQYLNDE